MRRNSSTCLFVLLMLTAEAGSRYIAPGSTPQGDYLRGLGVAAAGLGQLERDDAVAGAINTNSFIRLDSYMREVLRQGREDWAEHGRMQRERFKANYDAIKKRIREHPEALDVMTGSALNAVLDQLNNPAIQESSFRSAPVPLSPAMIRRIPFKLDEKGVIFSMQRLTARGKGKWPVAFQSDNYHLERKEFERAIDDAVEHMINGKMPPQVIKAYEASVRDLSNQLEREYGRSTDRRYQEAKARINEMEKATTLLKTLKIQPVMAELDHYTGKTVNDLRLFMKAHGLRFAVAENPEEKLLYPELYEALVSVREIVADQGKGRPE